MAEANEVYLGNSGGKSNGSYSVVLPKNIPVKGKAVFEGVNDNTVSLLQIRLSRKSKTNYKPASFDNFSLR